jgi:hypothetical protein
MKFLVLIIILVLLAGVFHMLFIMFNNVYYNNQNGIFKLLPDALNSSMDQEHINTTSNQTQMLRDAFGIGRVVCIGLVPIAVAIMALDRPKDIG